MEAEREVQPGFRKFFEDQEVMKVHPGRGGGAAKL
jgi:hypothetical protein